MSAVATGQDFSHEALFYAGRDEFLEGCASFIREGVAAGEPTLVVVSADKIERLRSMIGEDAGQVLFSDMAEVGANPARIIPAWHDFVNEHPGQAIRGIGEPICTERSAAELVECQRHESLLNLAFADTPSFRLLCPYDTSALSQSVIDEARRSHRHICRGGTYEKSDSFRGLEAVAAAFSEPLPEPHLVPQSKVFQANTLAPLRHFVAENAIEFGLDGPGTEELVLAVNEVATNSVVHGGGGGILRVWEDDHALICEVNDAGLLDNPLAGRELPDYAYTSGRGLWLANQVCDLVQMRSFGGGSAVRIHKRRA
jgi:anti-sigma regulatory factor (Ser/Thr protein kinase)